MSSWARGETLTVRGASAVPWEGSQAETVSSSRRITVGEICAIYEFVGSLYEKGKARMTYVFPCPCLDRLLKLAGAVVAPPGFGECWKILEAKIVEVDDEPLGVFCGLLFIIGVVELYVEPRRIHRLRSRVNKKLKCKIQESFHVGAIFYRSGIISL